MRQELNFILGEELRYLAIDTRERLGITQKEMGEKLYMSESSYSDIETGKTHCSMLSAMLLLTMQEEPKDFLRKAEIKIAEWYEREMQPV